MADEHNVFISWSGKRSRWAAEALREWLPVVLQSVRPWMSDSDIDKGVRWSDEVGKALEGAKIGIICLTPENLREPWLLFEAGALSKTLDARTRVCTYLLAGLEPQDVTQPLGIFQATKAAKEDTKKLLHTINRALEGETITIPEINLEKLFDGMWGQMEEKLKAMPAPDEMVEAKRPLEEMVAEILEFERAADKRRQEADYIDQYAPIMRELFPILGEFLKTLRNAQAHQAQTQQVVSGVDAIISTDGKA